MKSSKPPKPPKPLVDSNLLENKKAIKKYYLALAEQNSESSSLQDFTEQMTHKLIEILEFAPDSSGNLAASLSKLIEMQASESWPKFKEFFSIITTWVSNNKILTLKELKAQEEILQHLEKSIKQYQVLTKAAKDPEEMNLSKQVLELLMNGKKKIKAVYKKEEVKFSQRTKPNAQENKSIQEIFNFYAKQHVMTGKNPTFDMLGEIVENMDSGSFLHFAKHFSLCSNKKEESKRFLTKDETLKIFKHCAALQKSMNLQGFISALDEIAEVYFNGEYEKLVPFKCSSLDLDQKRIMLYEIMKLDNPNYVNKTCMPLRMPFGASHDKVIKPTIGKKVAKANEEEVKDQLLKYKKDKKSKIIALQEEKGKESVEKSKVADMRIKEKKEQDELSKRTDVFRIEDLANEKIQDFGEGERLEDLIQE